MKSRLYLYHNKGINWNYLHIWDYLGKHCNNSVPRSLPQGGIWGHYFMVGGCYPWKIEWWPAVGLARKAAGHVPSRSLDRRTQLWQAPSSISQSRTIQNTHRITLVWIYSQGTCKSAVQPMATLKKDSKTKLCSSEDI